MRAARSCDVRTRMPSRSILALSLAASLGSAGLERATAGSIVVTDCSDSDAGSLRAAVATANATKFYDTIDMTSLTCPSGLLLLNSAISITRDSLTVLGPGADALAVSGSGVDRVFYHSGAQTLTISNLTLGIGVANHSSANGPKGGCIDSHGYVSLDHARVVNCKADSRPYSTVARGGGIYAAGLRLQYSTLSGNSVYATQYEDALGGGAVISGTFSAAYSTISGNSVDAGSSAGGAVFFNGTSADIKSSTISGNTSRDSAGGVFLRASNLVTIVNSTISGNSTAGRIGGVFVYAPTVLVYHSTIAFNTAYFGNSRYSAGFHVESTAGTTLVRLYSNALAQNTYGLYGASKIENDFSTHASGSATVTVTGNANLVRAATALVPADTITGACPLFGPLRDNGGPTHTHALLSHSPAIDHGANPDARSQDQRGTANSPSYPRQSGSAVDIGAYEVQQDDIVFNAAFDGCAPL